MERISIVAMSKGCAVCWQGIVSGVLWSSPPPWPVSLPNADIIGPCLESSAELAAESLPEDFLQWRSRLNLPRASISLNSLYSGYLSFYTAAHRAVLKLQNRAERAHQRGGAKCEGEFC